MKESVHCNGKTKTSQHGLSKCEKLNPRSCVEGLKVNVEQRQDVSKQMRKPVSSLLEKTPLVPIENRYCAERMDHSNVEKTKCEGKFNIIHLLCIFLTRQSYQGFAVKK